ncbi:MAG: aminoacetone oxidase family FAD-binding enzyme [Bacteroidales bacterium]|nr:aminoacetone oxidase family FAD-binding enzyme [Bacteroidales bacterium]
MSILIVFLLFKNGMVNMRVAVVGGGAAGFFAAINVKEKFPEANVVIFEKSSSVLSKLKISGGGRCNITNAAKSINELSKAYPRGEKTLKKMFQRFSNVDAMDWFQKRGLPLTIQQDNCVFPVSQNSQSVIDCFLNVCEKLNITIKLNSRIRSLQMKNDKFLLGFQDGNLNSQEFDFVIITTGGSPKPEGLEWLKKLGHEISPPVPSLFSLSIKDKPLNKLMGVVVEDVVLKIQSEKLSSNGALLITHWGISGPATLKLSSFAARFMNEKNYAFKLQVNWVGGRNDELITQELRDISQNHQAKIMANYRPFNLPTVL